ncbi:hypothetical protein EDC02_7693 [Micromonospora sp. Llam0]|nr:hypothetical protein EDC02_7693 [Micromonospora sp. Llam0]
MDGPRAHRDRASDTEWEDMAANLDGYDEHCSNIVDLNESFLGQVFAEAGVPR